MLLRSYKHNQTNSTESKLKEEKWKLAPRLWWISLKVTYFQVPQPLLIQLKWKWLNQKLPRTQRPSTGSLSDVVGERWQECATTEQMHSCGVGHAVITVIYSSFQFKGPSVLKQTVLRGTGTEVCPWRHGPNSTESWQLLRMDGTLMDIKPHNGWIGKQKGAKEWWGKENVHSQRGTKREVCECEMGESVWRWVRGREGLEGVVVERE